MKKVEKLWVRETLAIYYRHLLRYRWAAIALVFVIVGASALSMYSPILVKQLIDDLSRTTLTGPEAFHFAFVQIAKITATFVVAWIFWRCSGFLQSYIQPNVRTDIERTALAELQRQSARYFADEFTGSLVRRVRGFATSYVDISDGIFGRFISLAIELGFLFVVFTSLNILFLPALLIWFFLFGTKSIVFARRKVAFDLERAKKDSQVTGVLSDVVTNHLNVKLFSATMFERENFFQVTEERKNIQVRSWRYGEWMLVGQNFISAIQTLTFLGLFAWLWSRGLVGPGAFVLAILYFNRLNRSMDDVGNVMRRIYEALAEAAEMTEIIYHKPDVLDKRGAKPLSVRRARIEFDHIAFSYYGDREVLDDFTLHVAAKEKIALVGPSGAGKSTIVKLLLRFYDVTSGAIRIDGQNIKDVTQDSLHEMTALVPQEPLLFHRSLKENIAYGRRDASEDEIIEAAKKAHCHEFISSLPHGYDTLVGERGVKLSGGERQRVAIARAILKNAPILALDEATSSLDSESEALIQDALKQLMKDKTVIVIAHRLSTIMQMDRIIVMERGRVVDQGTHDQLLKKVGIYQKLWHIQAGGFVQA